MQCQCIFAINMLHIKTIFSLIHHSRVQSVADVTGRLLPKLLTLLLFSPHVDFASIDIEIKSCCFSKHVQFLPYAISSSRINIYILDRLNLIKPWTFDRCHFIAVINLFTQHVLLQANAVVVFYKSNKPLGPLHYSALTTTKGVLGIQMYIIRFITLISLTAIYKICTILLYFDLFVSVLQLHWGETSP